MAKVVEVTDRTFEEEVLRSEVPTEVDFWAPWCGPCRMVSPIYDKLAAEYDDFKFCKINVDENQQTAARYQIMSIPMQMFFAEGEKVDEILGAVPEGQIRAKVDEIIGKYPTDEKSKLKNILSSWVDHNRQDGERFKKWTAKAKEMKNDPSYNSLVQASDEMGNSTERLAQLLSKL